ncbi:MAG TPA: hypothetical protein VHV30_03285 [Polyangiaceae bacterium]|nr:hypothetical protein [Polyangiaceae bacterium]
MKLLASRVVLLAIGAGVGLHGPSCGDSAPGSVLNAPCTRSSDCADDLMCVSGLCAMPDAAPRRGGLHAPCTETDDCADGLLCIDGTCLDAGSAGTVHAEPGPDGSDVD